MRPKKKDLESLLKRGYTLKQIAENFDRKSANTAKEWLKFYGLHPNRPTKGWTEEEDKFLIENYPSWGYDYCGEKLNRSKDSVYKRVRKIGIERNFNWQKLDKRFLEKEYAAKSIGVIADENNIKFWDVYAALIHYGIEINKGGKYFGKDHHNWKGYKQIPGTHWSSIRQAANKRNIDFQIDIKEAWQIFVEQNKKCKLSGVDIWFSPTGANRYHQTASSLDRIDSSLGYTVDNCQWLHKTVNQMKMSLTDDDFISWCSLVYNNSN